MKICKDIILVGLINILKWIERYFKNENYICEVKGQNRNADYSAAAVTVFVTHLLIRGSDTDDTGSVCEYWLPVVCLMLASARQTENGCLKRLLFTVI